VQYVKFTKGNNTAKELQSSTTYSVFRAKKSNTTTTKQKSKPSLPKPGIETGTSLMAVWCVTHGSPRQLNVSIEVKDDMPVHVSFR